MIQTLFENAWVSLKQVRDLDRGVSGYVYSHETRCHGRIVAVLPYRDTPGGREFLVKSECTPCWSMSQVLSAVTGGWEGGDIAEDAVRELAEETGYTVARGDLVSLGESYASKSSDTVYSLFAVDLTRLTPGEAVGDGSRLEAESSTSWLNPSGLAAVKDPQVGLMAWRLQALACSRADCNAGRPARWVIISGVGGWVCAVPDPERPDGICGNPVESEPCGRHETPERMAITPDDPDTPSSEPGSCPIYRPTADGTRLYCTLPESHNDPEDAQRSVHVDSNSDTFRVARCQQPGAHSMPHCWCANPGHHLPLSEWPDRGAAENAL